MSQTSYDIASAKTVSTDLTESERHRLLGDERRRIVLDVLRTRSTPVSLSALAMDVARRESDAGAPDESSLTRVEISLHHCHLPLMDDLGVLAYDRDAHRITQ